MIDIAGNVPLAASILGPRVLRSAQQPGSLGTREGRSLSTRAGDHKKHCNLHSAVLSRKLKQLCCMLQSVCAHQSLHVMQAPLGQVEYMHADMPWGVREGTDCHLDAALRK